jgi:hypothetical protein
MKEGKEIATLTIDADLFPGALLLEYGDSFLYASPELKKALLDLVSEETADDLQAIDRQGTLETDRKELLKELKKCLTSDEVRSMQEEE